MSVATKTKPTTATRLLGWCPICERDIKLTGNVPTLVHHGYKRPGDGYIHGDCFGVGWEPYERCKRACVEWENQMIGARDQSSSYLNRLLRGEVRVLHSDSPRSLEIFVAGVTSLYVWNARLEDEVRRTRYSIEIREREIARMLKLINAWSLKPVRTIEEQLEVERAAKAERKAERDAKNAAKAARRAELEARKSRWEAERAELIKKYRELFTKLAGEPVHAGTSAAAIGHWMEMHKAMNRKGYLHFYESALECAGALRKLHLAKEEGGIVYYAYPNGQLR